jgi:hypothetical protein
MCAVLLGELTPDGFCWRTSQESLWPTEVKPFLESSQRWPKTGSMQNGQVFELPTLAPRTSGSGGSFLPTPTTDDANNVTRASGNFQSLARTAYNLLPTPTAMDMGRGRTPEEWDAWTAKMRSEHKNGNGHGRSLEIEAMRLLPTPSASEHKYRLKGDSQQSKCLEALARRGELTSDHTPTPSHDGNPSSDGQHPNLPTDSDDSTPGLSSG